MKGIGKKKSSFLTTFFNRSLNLVHLHIFLPRLQYSYEARFTMSTYLCIQCAQSFTFEHYCRQFIRKVYQYICDKGHFLALYRQGQLLLNIFVANVKLDLRPIKPSSLNMKKRRGFHAGGSR